MAALYPNIYQRGRKTTLLTQEEAAERLHISPETLKRYEGGRLTPPDETVARMCEVYGVSWLALEHAKATDRLGILPELDAEKIFYKDPTIPKEVKEYEQPVDLDKLLDGVTLTKLQQIFQSVMKRQQSGIVT